MGEAVARSAYHHGSLRDSLIRASVDLIAREGIAAVSVRRVAREAGVSSGAPYHHFPDRSALFAAIAEQGSQILLGRLEGARGAAPDAAHALGAIVEAYVGFAGTHPAHIHVMLRPELFAPERHPDAAHAAQRAMALLTDTVEEGQRDGSVPAGDPAPMVHLIWALAVGIVTLWLDGPLEQTCASIDTTPERLTTRITALLDTLLDRASPATPE